MEGDHIFRCSLGIYISYIYVCDGNKYCPGDVAFDEVGCNCNTTLNYTNQCKLIKSSGQSEECSDFYLKDYTGTCYLYDFTFVTGKWSNTLMNRIVNHYGMTEKVEMKHEMLRYKPHLSCQLISASNNSFYKVSDICFYKLNVQGHILPCNKGEHLQSCQKFECNMMFKCPDFYCIPWSYICDGKWDCPSGYDESNLHQCENRTCINMFKFKMSSTCVHLGDVCNEVVDCPYGDDEFSCLLKCKTCPAVCECLGFVIRCYDTHISEYTLPACFSYRFVTIVNSRLFFEGHLQQPLQNVTFLSITSSNLQYLCPLVSLMKDVIVLDVSKNIIEVIQHNCFKNKVDLRVIKLNNNMLQHIQKHAFHQLISLLYMDLSNNMLTLIPKYFGISFHNLSYLSLQNNPLNPQFVKDILIRLNVKMFSTSHFSLCCFTSKNNLCSATKPWYISCSHILSNLAIKFAFCFLTIVIFGINILSIYLVIKSERGVDKIKSDTTSAFDMIVTSINIVDITGSIPLFILWVSDLYYKNDFVLIMDQWKSSIMCFISCGISIHFVLAAPFLHILLSYVRYMVVKNPIDTNFKSRKLIFQLISVGYSLSWLFAILITTLFRVLNVNLPTVYCSPFVDPSKTFSMTKTLTFVISRYKFFCLFIKLDSKYKISYNSK